MAVHRILGLVKVPDIAKGFKDTISNRATSSGKEEIPLLVQVGAVSILGNQEVRNNQVEAQAGLVHAVVSELKVA